MSGSVTKAVPFLYASIRDSLTGVTYTEDALRKYASKSNGRFWYDEQQRALMTEIEIPTGDAPSPVAGLYLSDTLL